VKKEPTAAPKVLAENRQTLALTGETWCPNCGSAWPMQYQSKSLAVLSKRLPSLGAAQSTIFPCYCPVCKATWSITVTLEADQAPLESAMRQHLEATR